MTRISFGLFGAGGSGREVMPYTRASVATNLRIAPDELDVYFVETWKTSSAEVNGYPLISLNHFNSLEGERYFNVAVGEGRARKSIVDQVGASAKVLAIHSPQAFFFDHNTIDLGGVFCMNTLVTSNVKIGKFFHANNYSSVAHDCVIGDFVTFAPGARCNGRVHIGDFAYIGAGAVIKQGTPEQPLRIGAGAVVGMGAVVTKDVPDGAIVVGNPARIMVRKA